MTCRGYDPKAVKIPKPIKVAASNILNDAERRGFYKSWARVIAENARQRSSRNKGE